MIHNDVTFLPTDCPLLVSCQPVFWIEKVLPADDCFILHHQCHVYLTLKSMLPDPVHCNAVRISATLQPTSYNNSRRGINLTEARKVINYLCSLPCYCTGTVISLLITY